MKKFFNYCFFFILANAGSLTGRVIRVCTDRKENPWKYEPPFNSWLEELKPDFIINGSAIVICIIIMIVLKCLIKKRERQGTEK